MNKVLVIEHQKDMYSMFDLILQFHGFDVTAVNDGRKAIEIIKDGIPFDAITLDLQLPGVPGKEIYDMLEKPVKIDDLVERVTEIVEHKVPALR